jgi:hypothetical protein
VLGLLDLDKGSGVVYVQEDVVVQGGSDDFAQSIVQGPILALATRRDRHPIHAAAIRRGDRALILHGPSGAGKSTVAYLASRAGVDVLSDDAIRVQLQPALRVWGGGGRPNGHVHLCADVHHRFADLRDQPLLRVHNAAGAAKYVVRVSGERPAPAPAYVHRVGVCLIERGRGPVACHAATPEEIVCTIVGAREARSDLYEPGRLAAAQAIAARGGWRVQLSSDPEEALPIVLDLLDAVSRDR